MRFAHDVRACSNLVGIAAGGPRRWHQHVTIALRCPKKIAQTGHDGRALAVKLLLAPLYFRLLITQTPLDDALAGRLVDVILRSVR